MKKERVNTTLTDNMIKVADILAKRRGMNRSEYINYLLNKDVDEVVSSMKYITNDYYVQ